MHKVAGQDGIVPEMLREVEAPLVRNNVTAFNDRFNDRKVDESLWKLILMKFIPKTKNKKAVDFAKEYRGICKIDTISKWYMNCVMIILEQYRMPEE